jgi:NADH:ubiquinone oxidoreductase subunit 5 (subunit L)/multisubunit Na+/H+ antiporter MnhA subunit
MEWLINCFIMIPLAGFLISVLLPKKNETALSRLAYTTIGINLFLALVFVCYWMLNGMPPLNLKEVSIYRAFEYDFYIDFYFDGITATYLLIGAMLTFIITIYSRYYLHREEGYKRFFNTILLFYLGYNIIIFSGNLETMFIGWEILGISSFLLIAFYRERYLPVKNAVKIFSIYRLGDVGLILAMWLSHHLWHENISFLKLNNSHLVHEHLQDHSWVGISIAFCIYIAAIAKSAQFPFSSWLPRAMEGPTPSSAIFYGSLSVHIGAFLLMRTFPFWEEQTSFRVVLVILGIITAIFGTLTARVQSSVKSQIAYSSVGQIGLIFIEIALGLELLALIHIAGNAFLRTYQLLVSPSVVSYKIREQLYNFKPVKKSLEDNWPKKIENTLYILSVKEWNLDSYMYRFLWNPLKKLGASLSFLTFKNSYLFFGFTMLTGIVFLVFENELPKPLHDSLPFIFGIVAFLVIVKSFTERNSARLSWSLLIANHFFIALAISFNEHFDSTHHIWYLSGVIMGGALGFYVIQRMRNLGEWISLDRFYGHVYEHPKMALLFLCACLGLSGFPISPTFIGEDLIFSHIKEEQIWLALFVSLSFIINGLAVIRIYARIFLGPHFKTYHEVAKRSS